jgi:hypothetical protein
MKNVNIFQRVKLAVFFVAKRLVITAQEVILFIFLLIWRVYNMKIVTEKITNTEDNMWKNMNKPDIFELTEFMEEEDITDTLDANNNVDVLQNLDPLEFPDEIEKMRVGHHAENIWQFTNMNIAKSVGVLVPSINKLRETVFPISKPVSKQAKTLEKLQKINKSTTHLQPTRPIISALRESVLPTSHKVDQKLIGLSSLNKHRQNIISKENGVISPTNMQRRPRLIKSTLSPSRSKII